MFHSARIKLTAWYLLIIMTISILFSFGFYQASTNEIQRVIKRMESRRAFGIDTPPPGLYQINPSLPSLADLQEAEYRLIVLLILINIGVILSAGAAGYFLAGKTLLPIQEMVDEQNRFITDASHELRTPITALRAEMEASLLQEHISEKETRAVLSSNLEEVISLQALTDNLLQLAASKKDTPSIIFEPILLKNIITIAIKKVKPLAHKKAISITAQDTTQLVYGNNMLLTQLFIILLDNAIKYSDNHKDISITTKTIANEIVISVKDHGKGIEKADLDHLFERFYRSDKSRTKTQTQGYGLGLSIAHHIVTQHKGKISIESKADEGTTVIIFLPKS